MEIIVHKHFALSSPGDTYQQYQTPVWEIEIKSPVLDTIEFQSALHDDNNFVTSPGHHTSLRSKFNGTGVVGEFLKNSQKNFVLDTVSQSATFQARYYKSLSEYQDTAVWFTTILRDQAKFAMAPHLDNSHVMVQIVVNLLQDNETSTEFYNFNESTPCYRAPLKKNHGVMFLNTPGSMHSITNNNNTRWILYGGLLI
jgi:hypothetical protein